MEVDKLIKNRPCICLGIFNAATFRQLEKHPHIVTYDEFPTIGNGSVFEDVKRACEWAKQIIFVLDNLYSPVRMICASITCGELIIVCQSDDFFDKTTFILSGEVVNIDRYAILNEEHLKIIPINHEKNNTEMVTNDQRDAQGS